MLLILRFLFFSFSFSFSFTESYYSVVELEEELEAFAIPRLNISAHHVHCSMMYRVQLKQSFLY